MNEQNTLGIGESYRPKKINKDENSNVFPWLKLKFARAPFRFFFLFVDYQRGSS